MAEQGQSFGFRRDRAFQLGVFDGVEHLFEGGAGLVAGGDQLATGEERRGADGFFGHGFVALADKVPVVDLQSMRCSSRCWGKFSRRKKRLRVEAFMC